MATRWHPDTCDCIIEYDGYENDKFINPVIIQSCQQHKKFEHTVQHNRAHKRLHNGTVVPRDHKE